MTKTDAIFWFEVVMMVFATILYVVAIRSKNRDNTE